MFFSLHQLSRSEHIAPDHRSAPSRAETATFGNRSHTVFRSARDARVEKKTSTSEVLDWLKLLLAEDLTAEDLRRDGVNALPRLHGALLKNEQDVHLFERLAFMARAQR